GLHDVSHAAPVHKQQTNPRTGFHSSEGCAGDTRRLTAIGRYGSGPGVDDAEGHWLLQSPLAKGGVVSRAFLARWLSGKLGRDVRSRSSQRNSQARGMESARLGDSCDQGPPFRTGLVDRRTRRVDRFLANTLEVIFYRC